MPHVLLGQLLLLLRVVVVVVIGKVGVGRAVVGGRLKGLHLCDPLYDVQRPVLFGSVLYGVLCLLAGVVVELRIRKKLKLEVELEVGLSYIGVDCLPC